MIELSDSEKEKIVAILAHNPGQHLRLVVDGDGCAGPYFNLSLDEAAENELTTTVNGLEILVSDHVKRLAEISTIRLLANISSQT